MRKIKLCGFFIFFLFNFCFAQDNQDFDKIIVTKSQNFDLNQYYLDSESISYLPFSSPIESLNTLPIDLQARSPKASIQTDFSLRGSNYEGVAVLLEGTRINDPQTGHHNSDVPLTSEDISRINVDGRSIDFIIRRPEYRRVILEASGGQYNTFSGLASVSEKIKDLGVRVSIENKESDGFREDTDFKKFTASFASALDIPLGSVDTDFGFQEKEFGAFDFYTPGKGYQSKEWTKTYLLNTKADINKYGLSIKPDFLWRRHFDKFMLDKTNIRSNFLSHHRTDIFTPSLYFKKNAMILGDIGLGLEYGQEKINSTTLGKHTREHKSVYLDDAYNFTDQLSSGVSFRWDDFDSFGKSYTGSLNLRYELDRQNAFKIGISRYVRIPSFTEIYYNDPTTIGNLGLSPEKSITYEAGYELKKEIFSWGTTIFLRREDNYIDWVKSSQTQAKWQTENIASSDVFGIEESLQAKLNKYIELNANYIYTNRKLDDNGYIYKYGPNYSRHIVNSTLLFNLPFGTQELGFTYKKKPLRDGWFLLSSKLNYNINKNAKVFLSVTNILNVEYQEIEGIPQPGRWVESGMRLEW